MKPLFFATPGKMRSWLEKNHDKCPEVLVGFYKKDSGKPSITWPESVDVALCFGWIDGVRRSLGEISYTIRFTPRRPTSTWSAINIKRMGELEKLGLVHSKGLQAFEKRSRKKSGIYAYEQRSEAKLDAGYENKFKANKKAWEFFQSQPPWYQRISAYWVMTAKQEETRIRRLEKLIDDSAHCRDIRPLRKSKPAKS